MSGQLRLRENLSRVDWEFVATVLSAVAMLIWSLLCDGATPRQARIATGELGLTWLMIWTTVWIIRSWK